MKLEQVIHAEIVRADLVLVDARFSSVGIGDLDGMVHLKAAFISLANAADFELQARPSYKEYPTPAALVKELKQNLEFAKYLRNKVVGHLHPELIPKAIEWQPMFRHMPGRFDKPGLALIANLWLLETAINTYVDQAGKHKVFETETDLMYPPDWARFRDFLEVTIRGSLAYLSSLVDYWAPKVAPLDASFDLELAVKAGNTDFKFLAQ
jgi:hypothetical protein